MDDDVADGIDASVHICICTTAHEKQNASLHCTMPKGDALVSFLKSENVGLAVTLCP